MAKIAKAYLDLLICRPPAPSKKCLEIVVEPFNDCWLEYEEIGVDVQV
jgi:hypothetical protein